MCDLVATLRVLRARTSTIYYDLCTTQAEHGSNTPKCLAERMVQCSAAVQQSHALSGGAKQKTLATNFNFANNVNNQQQLPSGANGLWCSRVFILPLMCSQQALALGKKLLIFFAVSVELPTHQTLFWRFLKSFTHFLRITSLYVCVFSYSPVIN